MIDISPHLLLLLITLLFPFSAADVGTATRYSFPYVPTACFGNDQGPFPANNHFAAAGEGVWDNGSGCGKRLKVRCIYGECKTKDAIEVLVLDNAETSVSRPAIDGASLVLSEIAFNKIANSSAARISIEFEDLV